MAPAQHLLLLAIGAATGVLAALIGVGGGLVIVPVLTQMFGFAPAAAVGTSLCCVFLNSVSGSVEYLRQRRVDVPLGLLLAAATLPGAGLGTWLVQRAQSGPFDILFGTLMAVVGVLMLARRGNGAADAPPAPWVRGGRERTLTDAAGRAFAYRVSRPLGAAVSAVVGVLAAFFGVGGGLIHVPFLHRAFGMAIHVAVATSLFTLVFTSAAGAAGQIAYGRVAWAYVPGLGLGVVAGAQLGARLAPKTKPRLLAVLVALALAGVGARLIWRGMSE
jgi:uncharacterized membrane protein YfcA